MGGVGIAILAVAGGLLLIVIGNVVAIYNGLVNVRNNVQLA